MVLTEEENERYNRQLILKDIGIEGQEKLKEAKVLVIGSGGLGSPILHYLGAAGVGTLGVADGDVVELSNLQRQVIHFTSDLNRPKVESAKEKIQKINPHVTVNVHNGMVTAENIEALIKKYDFVLDGTDNFAAKFLINDACVLTKTPFSHAGILQCVGQTMTVLPFESACYRCVFSEPPPLGTVPLPNEAGVLGSVAGTIGTLQATEAVKFVIGKGKLLTNRLLYFDGLEMEFRTIALSRSKDCPVCGDDPSISSL
jgi:molybdopterin-synthase adenylyltransferase